MKLSCFIPVILLTISLATQAHAEMAYREAGERLDGWCEEHGIPLAEAYYVDSTGTTVSLWHGDPDLSAAEVAIWPIGSITKTFTAMLALELQEAGYVDLDAALSTCVPEIDDMFSEAALGTVSLRTLMHHRSGLPYQLGEPEDYAPLVPIARLLLGKQPRLGHAALLSTVSGRPLEFEPGTGYQYSNANFWLAALALERATGRDYDDLLQQYVLDPLGLEQTTLWDLPQDCLAMPAHIAVNGQLLDISGWDMPGLGRSAGGIRCSTADLLKFSDALRDREGQGIMSRDQLAQLYDFIDTGGSAHGEPYSYGLGISRRFDGSRWMYGHNGTTPGNRALWRFDPQTGETLIIFSSLGSQGLTGLADEMLAILGELEHADW